MLKLFYLLLSFIGAFFTTAKMNILGKLIGYPVLFILILVYYLILFGINLLVFILVSLSIDKNKIPDKVNNIYRIVGVGTIKVFVDSMNVKIHVNGMENFKSDRFLFVGNHKSAYDPLVSLIAFKKKKLAFVSKKENLSIPFVGRYMKAIGCLSLDRENAVSALQSINQAADFIKSGKANMGIYPEGKVNPSTNVPLLPFRSGALKAARKAGADIVVSTIRGTEHIRDLKRLWKKKHVYIDILDTIPAETVKSMKTNALSDMISDMMIENLSKYYSPATQAE